MAIRKLAVLSILLFTTISPVALAASQTSHQLEHATNPVPANFVIHHDDLAAALIPRWVDLINHRDYEASAALWVSERRRIEQTALFQKYLSNIRHVTLLQYKDVTSDWGGIPMDLSHFHAVKVYAAILDYDVVDKKSANVMVGKKLHRCFVVKETASSPWQLFMMQGYATFSAPKSWNLNLQGVTNYGNMYGPAPSNESDQGEPQDESVYEDFIKLCIGPAVQKAVDSYYRAHRRVPYWQIDILDIKPLEQGAHWFEITVRVQTSSASFKPPYGLDTISLTNKTQPGDGTFKVVKFDHQDIALS